MRSTKSYLLVAFIIAFSVLLIIPLWAVYGVLFPDEGGHVHGGGETVTAVDFQQKMNDFIEEYSLPDGSVEHHHEGPAYIMASQYSFTPSKLRMKTGEHYNLQFLSSDVVHAISVQMNGTSYNTVVMPMMVTSLNIEATRPGTYLVICNEYCGIGHDYMYLTLIVEEGPVHTDEEQHEEDEHLEHEDEEHHNEEDEHHD